MKDFKILSIDADTKTMVIDWGHATFNHWIPDKILENKNMSKEDMLVEIYKSRPPEPEPVEVPSTLYDLVTIEPKPQNVVPQYIRKDQGMFALTQTGYWDEVLDYIEALEDPIEKAVFDISLQHASVWFREDEIIKNLSVALDIKDSEMDDIFIFANTTFRYYG